MGTWGFIERQIGTLICNHFPHAPEKLRKNGLPSTLEQKIKYLVEIAKDERMPEQLRLEIREWVSELHRLRLHRHLIAHGTLFQRNTFSVRWYVHELTLRGDRPEFTEHSFTDEDLRAKQKEISDLSHRMASTLNPFFFGPNWRHRWLNNGPNSSLGGP